MIVVQGLASLALRVALALPFWLMGLTRWQGFLELRPETLRLYEAVYEPVLLGRTYALPYPDVFAWVVSFAEVILPAALVLGFATRLSALGLLILTGFLFTIYPSLGAVPPPWPTETLPWAAMGLALVAYGAGIFSFDRLIWESVRGR